MWEEWKGTAGEEAVGRAIVGKWGCVVGGRGWSMGLEVADCERPEEAEEVIEKVEGGRVKVDAVKVACGMWPMEYERFLGAAKKGKAGGEEEEDGVEEGGVDEVVKAFARGREGCEEGWRVLLGPYRAENGTVGRAVVKLCAGGRFEDARR